MLVVGAAMPAAAAADGLPVMGIDGGRAGIPSPDGDTRFVTRKAAANTRVSELRDPNRAVVRSRVVPGRYTIPIVALDSTPSGLSADGRTLVLINPRRTFPRERTAFTVLDARTLRIRTVLRFKGDYSFDALSPNGRWLYLIEYTSRRDPRNYAVRAYDLRAGRMLPKEIVDPTEPDEAMRGFPLTRATTANGRWEYTLYDGGGSHPFVHALDTVGQKALCLDLDVLEGDSNVTELRLKPEPGGTITLHYSGTPMAFIDRQTRRVTEPAVDSEPPVDSEPVVDSGAAEPPAARERASQRDALPRAVQIALMALLALAIVASAAALAIGRRKDDEPAVTHGPDDEHWYSAP